MQANKQAGSVDPAGDVERLGLDPPHTGDMRAAWERAAAQVLRRAGRLGQDDPDSVVWQALTAQTADGVELTPLGTPEQVGDLPPTGLPGRAPFTRGTASARPAWDVRARHADPDAATTRDAALADLEGGSTSLWVAAGSGGVAVSDLAAALEQVHLDLAPVVLDAPDDPVAAADAYAAVLADRDVAPAPGTNLGGDPYAAAIRSATATSRDDARQVVTPLAERASHLGTYALAVDGTAVHDAGASDVQELAYALAAGAAYLRDLTGAGYAVDDALGLMEFRYAATCEQFPTIAKLRAARRLWHRVAELSGAGEARRGQVQHAVTSAPMLTRYDPYVNMLRTTVAAFAAGAGGAAAVTVLPFDAALGLPDAFSRRIARNTSCLLLAESHVAAVTDPAGGAHAVERLTDDLARAAWAEFGRIEETGDLAAVLEDGSLLDAVGRTATARAERVATLRQPIVGVSEFPSLGDSPPDRRPHPEGAARPDRYAAPFEKLRDDPVQTPVFLATMGTVAAHTARASYLTNVLATGGMDAVAAGATEGVDDVVRAYAAVLPTGAPVVALAGSDEAYAAWGADLVRALRESGARWVLLAGDPEASGLAVDDHAVPGVDVLALARRTRAYLDTGVSR